MALEQKTRLLNLKTPLPENALVLTSFTGREAISALFNFHLELISDDPAIKASDVVGKNVRFSVERKEGERQYFNGFVSRFLSGDEEPLYYPDLLRLSASVVAESEWRYAIGSGSRASSYPLHPSSGYGTWRHVRLKNY